MSNPSFEVFRASLHRERDEPDRVRLMICLTHLKSRPVVECGLDLGKASKLAAELSQAVAVAMGERHL